MQTVESTSLIGPLHGELTQELLASVSAVLTFLVRVMDRSLPSPLGGDRAEQCLFHQIFCQKAPEG